MDQKVINHFKKHDPVLYSYIEKIKIAPVKKDKPVNYFSRLCKEIICQQLSGKAGDAIFGRFQKLFPNGLIQPLDILSIAHDKLRAVGMSHAKARYVRNLAEAIIHKDLAINHLDSLDDEAVIKELTKVKGIGRWTAEMFLTFVLMRENVFSFGDLGLRKGIMKIYGFKKKPSIEKIKKIVARWSPYKSFASRILWRCLETK